MCGIFGIVTGNTRQLEQDLVRLFELSESRGKEAAGIAIMDAQTIRVMKEPESASELIGKPAYKKMLAATHSKSPAKVMVIGHSRLVTNGSEAIAENNQPVIRDGLVAIHNGIIVNDKDLWKKNADLVRNSDVDTEVLVALVAKNERSGRSFSEAVADGFSAIDGTASVAILNAHQSSLALATNNGSLYYYQSPDGSEAVFASERYILTKFLEDRRRLGATADQSVEHVKPNTGIELRLSESGHSSILFGGLGSAKAKPSSSPTLRIVNYTSAHDPKEAKLRRCSKCILPETMPFICFDADGVCNYCKTYKLYRPRGIDALREKAKTFRRKDGRPDCMIAVSGGRDSCYGLHVLKAKLGLNPVAYTYDWGLITDLARRNQARLCGKLGVEHILVSADIRKKREYVRKNVTAWLKRPELGMIPLFMAGDKQYFYYADQVRRQLGTDVTFLCENVLERAHFKSGFMGVNEGHRRVFDVGLSNKLAVLFYYAKQYALNPRYINASMVDTASAFHSAYFRAHTQIQLFDYVPWVEDDLVGVLRSEYDWELDPETTSTWRIGDGTAAFYNYIYYTIAGFTENDALRSNQIREGVITREKALELVARENQPRWTSLQWYANTIGFSLSEALQVINTAPRLYQSDPVEF